MYQTDKKMLLAGLSEDDSACVNDVPLRLFSRVPIRNDLNIRNYKITVSIKIFIFWVHLLFYITYTIQY